jgi:hypothetical protein
MVAKEHATVIPTLESHLVGIAFLEHRYNSHSIPETDSCALANEPERKPILPDGIAV